MVNGFSGIIALFHIIIYALFQDNKNQVRIITYNGLSINQLDVSFQRERNKRKRSVFVSTSLCLCQTRVTKPHCNKLVNVSSNSVWPDGLLLLV